MKNYELSDLNTLADRSELLALLLAEEGFSSEQKKSIPPRKGQEHLPLSFAQQRLWFLNQLVPGNPFYNVPGIINLRGWLDIAALDASLNEIVRRHEVLRTSFPDQGGQPLQVITPYLALSMPVVDLQGIGSKELRDTVAQQLIRQEAQQPFHLSTGPLMRVTLLHIAREEYILLLDMHHIVCDGWSMGVFFRELATLYGALRAGQPTPLPALPIQYADYALWQRDWVEHEIQEEQMRYWRHQLQNAPTLLELPTDFPRPALQSFRGAMNTFTLSPELTVRCKELALQTGTTFFMVLLAVFNVLLYRYTRQTDLVVGTPIANRTRPEIEGLIGFFVNTLALRVDVTGNPTFLKLLERVKVVALDAYAHQDLPFERLVEELQPERSLSHMPLVQVLFAVQNVHMEPQQMSGLTLQPGSFDEGIAPFDLSLFFKERGDAVTVDLVYSTDLFLPETMQRLEGHLLCLLQAAVAHPQTPIAALPLLTETERQQILYSWNRLPLDYPRDIFPQQLFEAQATRTPDTVALAFQGSLLTYETLDRLSNQLAHYLRKQGVGPDVPVGLCVERSLEMVIGMLAILKAGGAYVPFNADYPYERLAFLLADTQAPILLTQEHLRKRFLSLNVSLLCLDSALELLAQESSEALPIIVHPDNLGNIIYTSGSTGLPKGVMICFHTFTNLVLWQRTFYPTTGRSLQFSQLSFDISSQEILTTLCFGGTLIIPTQEQRRDPEMLLSLLYEQHIERLFLPFVALQALAEAFEQSNIRPDCLREIFTAGEQLRLTQPVRYLLAHLTGCRLHNNYGPSESHVTTIYSLPLCLDTCSNLPPVGRPIANGMIYLLDQYLQPVPVGVAGEVYIGGDLLLARGYLNRPDLSAEKFIPNPFVGTRLIASGASESGTRLYRTGDLARYLADGTIEFIGRIDFQVKIRGYRVEPGEIETVLEQHPTVQEAVVTVREEQAGKKQLVAYLIPVAGQMPHGAELRHYLLERLPEYMVPSAFMSLEVWPLTSSGKINRRALPTPGTEHWSGAGETTIAPRDPIEDALADIWTQVLGHEPTSVYHNFFESGGHSLLATQVMSRVRRTFQIELPLRTLFEAPTIAELGVYIRCAIAGEQNIPTLQPRAYARNGNPPMSFVQQRMWFLHQLMPDNPSYNIAGGLRLSGLLDVMALEGSLNEIVRRHEVLRTRFAMQEEQPVQIILPTLSVPFLIADLQCIAEDEREALLQQIARDEGNRLFDLRQGPLLHLVSLRLSAQEHILLLCLHHSICDGWSLNVLFRELTTIYEALTTRQPSPLPPLPLQYADYALWQHEWLQSEVLETQLSYWRCTLNGLVPLELPTDFPRPLIQAWRGAVHTVHLPLALCQDLRALSQREGVTLFMTLLATFQILLWRYSGQPDIAVGTPIANRNRAESEDLIGCFVNTLVLRSDLIGNPRFREFLRQVKEVCLGAYAHQDLPFERIVEELQPERDLSRSPLFQALFALHNLSIADVALPGLCVSPLDIELETVKFDLNLSLWETAHGLEGHLRYCSDLFSSATMERMMHHWRCLLEAVVSQPETRLSELPLLTTEERQLLLIAWNATHADYTLESTLSRRFEERVALHPDAVALVDEDEMLTYDQLNSKANQLACYLRKHEVGPEKLVGLLMERSLELLMGVVGVLKAGGAYVPLDPTTPTERLRILLQDASINMLLTRVHLRERLKQAPETTMLYLEELWEQFASESTANPAGNIFPEMAAYVLYTSGSTGRPKGVVVAHRQALNYVEAIKQRVELQPGASYALLQPLTVDSSVTMLWGALLTGGRLLLVGKEQALDAEALAAIFAREPADYLKIAPSHLAALLTGIESRRLLPRKGLIIGGEASRWEWTRQLAAWMAEGKLYNHYGPTEATVGVLTFPIEATEEARGLTPLGRPLERNQMYVLDGDMQPAPIGVYGELYIGGEQVVRGYLGNPALTAAWFVPDPFVRTPTINRGGTSASEPGARLYRTGDIVRYRADGVLEFVGRRDEQVKIRGYRVELGEIEAVLNQHPQVREALIVTREAMADEKHLLAYILAKAASAPGEMEILGFMRERLPEYMVPIAVITLEQWPRTPHGKIDRQALPIPDLTGHLADNHDSAPRTPVEKLLARIWMELLRLERVGIYDNFFDLGGDSILSIKVVARARQAGLFMSPRHLFQAQNIFALARLLGSQPEAQTQGWGVETGSIPLTPIQHWFFEKSLPEPHHWNQPLQLALADEIDETLFEAAIQQVFDHHKILQARCIQGAEGWQLYLGEDTAKLPWNRVDLSLLSVEEQGRAMEMQARQMQASLSFTAGPLGCVVLFDLGQERGRHVLWIIHHLLVDAISQSILLEDLQQAYRALQQRLVPRLQLPTTAFARWARLLRAYARAPELQGEKAYWLDARWENALHIPVDFPLDEQSNVEGTARTLKVSLTPEETQILLQEVPGVYRTQINDALLTALVQSFAHWTGEHRLLLHLEGHGREELFDDVDLSRSVGWFTTRFPVLLSLEAAEGGGYIVEPGEALVAVKEQLRQVPHHGIGYGVLRYLSEDQATVARLQSLPVPKVSFNYFGRQDAGEADTNTLFAVEQNPCGAARSSRGARSYWLEINAQLLAGQLTFNWTYSEHLHRSETIEKLSNDYLEALRAIIAHCQSPEAGDYAPSDFPLAMLDEQKLSILEKLLEKRDATRGTTK